MSAVPADAPPADPAELDEAVALAREAGELTLGWFRSERLIIDEKGDGSPVTQADRAAERLIRQHLGEHHPDDGIHGEEEGEHTGPSGRQWIVDPIDGTKAFSHGVPTYCNLVALEDEHGIAIGVINLPALGETIYAGRGLGCWSLDHAGGPTVPAQVSQHDRLEVAYLSTSGFDYWPGAWLDGVRASGAQLRTWGDGWGYALVATGRIDVMVDPYAAVWDVAPAEVIVAEAGGVFTDHRGQATVRGGSGIGSNGLVHQQVLAALPGDPPPHP